MGGLLTSYHRSVSGQKWTQAGADGRYGTDNGSPDCLNDSGRVVGSEMPGQAALSLKNDCRQQLG